MKEEITLPSPRLDGPMSLEATIATRRSVRSYSSYQLSMEEIGQLLWATQGITGEKPSRRAAPSAGGRHPLELYICKKDGIWHYRPHDHRLLFHLGADVREGLVDAAWGQEFVAQAPVVFAMSAVFQRTTSRYGERGGERYVAMDAGHAAQNLLLQAVTLDLGGVSVGAFDDDAVRRVLDLPEVQDPLYLIPVGRPAVE